MCVRLNVFSPLKLVPLAAPVAPVVITPDSVDGHEGLVVTLSSKVVICHSSGICISYSIIFELS